MTSIKIGYSLSLTGAFEAFGQSAFLAHKIWEENVNKKGGLLGRRVELVCMDDKSNAHEAAHIYKELLDVEKVDVVIGGYGSASTSMVIPMMAERQKFFVALMSKINGVANCFSMIPTEAKPNTALTESFFKSLSKNSSVAIIAADSDCTKNSVAGARENIVKNSHRLIFEYNYSLSTPDFSTLAEELRALRPNVVYIAAYASDSLGIIKAINDIGFQPKKIGASVVQHLGLKNMYCGLDEIMEQYLSRTSSIEEDTLGYCMAPQAYAQLQIVEQAIKATNSLNDLKLIGHTREAVFKTVLGDLKFDRNGECAAPEMLQVQYHKIMTHDKEQVFLQ
jgi:branched-chain amino acid transport system substrate-binding protein